MGNESKPFGNGSAARDTGDAYDAARDHAPGAIPPTGGAPPRMGQFGDAGAGGTGSSAAPERSPADDLADGIELLRRAARKTLRAVDPRIEELAERAVTRLKELDEGANKEFSARAAQLQELEKVADETGQQLVAAVERLAERIESAVRPRGPSA